MAGGGGVGGGSHFKKAICKDFKRVWSHLKWLQPGNLLQHSCLENLMNRGAWQARSTGLQRV